MSEPTSSLLAALKGFASNEPAEYDLSDDKDSHALVVSGRFAGPPTRQEVLRLRAIELARPDLLWAPTSTSRPEGWADLKGAHDDLRKALPEVEAPSIDLLSRLTPEERLARKATKITKNRKRAAGPLDPVSDFIDLAWRYRLHGLKEVKGVKSLTAAERLRLADYWSSENQRIFAEAYRAHLVALHEAGKANREVGRMHDLLVTEILKGKS